MCRDAAAILQTHLLLHRRPPSGICEAKFALGSANHIEPPPLCVRLHGNHGGKSSVPVPHRRIVRTILWIRRIVVCIAIRSGRILMFGAVLREQQFQVFEVKNPGCIGWLRFHIAGTRMPHGLRDLPWGIQGVRFTPYAASIWHCERFEPAWMPCIRTGIFPR